MECFWDTVDTIGEGFGFSLFGARHLVTLALYIGFAALSCKRYKAADEKKRAQLRGLFAVLLLADEAFKQIGLQIGGNFNCQLGVSPAAPVLDQHFSHCAARVETEQAA